MDGDVAVDISQKKGESDQEEKKKRKSEPSEVSPGTVSGAGSEAVDSPPVVAQPLQDDKGTMTLSRAWGTNSPEMKQESSFSHSEASQEGKEPILPVEQHMKGQDAQQDKQTNQLYSPSGTPSEAKEPTIYEKFEDKRQRKARPYVHCLVLLAFCSWFIHSLFSLLVVWSDDMTNPLFEYLLLFKCLYLIPLGFATVVTGMKKMEHNYMIPLACALLLYLLNTCAEGATMDVLIRRKQLYGQQGLENSSAVVASRMFGSHQVLHLCVVLLAARLLVLRVKHLVWMKLTFLVGMIIILLGSMGDGEISFVNLQPADVVRALVAIVATILVNIYASYLWNEDEWRLFVQRKRLQLQSVRAEELLTLAMPRDIAHQLMLGKTEPKQYESVSIAFLYIADYKPLVHYASNNGVILDFMDDLHQLYCRLDSIVLTHPNVYKIESVANCYMVAGGVPKESPDHGSAVLDFCLEALDLSNKFCDISERRDSSFPKSNLVKRDPACTMKFKIGVHTGPVTTGVVGKTRTFYRLFGDTVNMASRMGTSSYPGCIRASKDFYEAVASPEVETLQTSLWSKSEYKVHTPETISVKGKGENLTYLITLYDTVNETISDVGSDMLGSSDSSSPPFPPRGRRNSYDLMAIQNNQPPSTMAAQEKGNPKSNTPAPTRGLSTKNEFSSGEDQSYSHMDNVNKFEKARRTVISVSTLLRMSLDEALMAYKHMKDVLVEKDQNYFVGKIEQLYMRRFLQCSSFKKQKGQRSHTRPSLYFSNDRSSKAQVSPVGHSDEQVSSPMKRGVVYERGEENRDEENEDAKRMETMTMKQDVEPCTLLRQLCSVHHLRSRFEDDYLEGMYQRQVDALIYRLAHSSSIVATVFFVWGVAVYSQGMIDKVGQLMAFSFGIAVTITLIHIMLRRFAHLQHVRITDELSGQGGDTESEDRSSEDTSKLQDCEMKESKTRRIVRNRSRKKSRSVVLSSGTEVPISHVERIKYCFLDSVIVSKVRRFLGVLLVRMSSWIILVMWLTAALVTGLDQTSLSEMHPDIPDTELCLSSFVPPIVLLSAFQIFRTGIKSQGIAQVISALVFALGFLSSKRMIGCSAVVQVLGFYLIIFILLTATIDSVVSDTRNRRAMVLRHASRHAKQEADAVLNQLLPKVINDRLEKNEAIPFELHPDNVVILWADVVGFTELSSQLTSTQVMQMLNRIYSRFDKIIEDENLWKMDTIGDAYVVIGGLVEDSDNPRLTESLFRSANSMLEVMQYFRRQTQYNIGIRIGIHAGKVASGIIGTLRPRYYVFGSTVLEAEALESSSRSNEIQVSEMAARYYRATQFNLKPNVNNTSSLRTYWLSSPDPSEEDEPDLTDN